jgi:hypothetical protein
LYGIFLKAPPVIITNGVTLALVVGIVGLKAKYGRAAFNAEPQRKAKAKS